MIEASIQDGDWIAIRKADTAETGQIVVAMRNGEATVKVLKIEKDTIVLKSHSRTVAQSHSRTVAP